MEAPTHARDLRPRPVNKNASLLVDVSPSAVDPPGAGSGAAASAASSSGNERATSAVRCRKAARGRQAIGQIGECRTNGSAQICQQALPLGGQSGLGLCRQNHELR